MPSGIRSIVITGDDAGPLRPLLAGLRVMTDWPLPADAEVDLLVVGDAQWDEVLIVQALRQSHRDTAVLPVVGAVELLQGGRNWWKDAGLMREAVANHEGLR